MSLTVFALRARAELLLRFAFREWTIIMTGGRGLLNAESVMMCLMAPEDVFEAFGGPELRGHVAQVPESAPGQAVDVICRALRESSVPPVAAALEWINTHRHAMPWLPEVAAADDDDIPESVLGAAGAFGIPEGGSVADKAEALARSVGPKMHGNLIRGVLPMIAIVAAQWADKAMATPAEVDELAAVARKAVEVLGDDLALRLLQAVTLQYMAMMGGGIVITPGGGQ